MYKSQQWPHHHLIADSLDDRNERNMNYSVHINRLDEGSTSLDGEQNEIKCFDYNNSDDSESDKKSSPTSSKVAIIRGNNVVVRECYQDEEKKELNEQKDDDLAFIPDPYPPSTTNISESNQVPSSLNTITAQSKPAAKMLINQRLSVQQIQPDEDTHSSNISMISFDGQRVDNELNDDDDPDISEIVNMLRTADKANEFIYDKDDVLKLINE